MSNPFSTTHAHMLTDAEILQYWVSPVPEDAVAVLAKPASRKPMYVVGGKGSGKTHLMRYISATVQRLKFGDPSAVLAGGHLGVYVRCSTISAERFSGRSQSEDAWKDVFAYFTDLVLVERYLRTVNELFGHNQELRVAAPKIVEEVRQLIDGLPEDDERSLRSLERGIATLRRGVDRIVSNVSVRRVLDVTIGAPPMQLVFGVPEVLRRHWAPLQDVIVQYLVDEYENLSLEQQVYVNTLVRSACPPVSFKVGSRLYGLRTMATYSAGEELREGAEYERLHLDDLFRRDKGGFARFSMELVIRRLSVSGMEVPTASSTGARGAAAALRKCFQEREAANYYSAETEFIRGKYHPLDRPWFRSLRARMALQGRRKHDAWNEKVSEEVIRAVAVEEAPLLEKLNVFMVYQAWYRGQEPLQAVRDIARQCALFRVDKSKARHYAQLYKHWATDMLAQLLRDADQRQVYAGFDTMVEMSAGIPRHLLMILSHVYDWAVFKGERAFAGDQVSVESQREGIRAASEWFLGEARLPGADEFLLRGAVDRLGEFFRSLRFVDKPVEVSLTAFSFDLGSVASETRSILDRAEKWSFLVSVPGGRRDRNSSRVDATLQLSPMLAPIWDLPTARRGIIALASEEVQALVNPDETHKLRDCIEARRRRLNAPFVPVERSDTPTHMQLLFPQLRSDD